MPDTNDDCHIEIDQLLTMADCCSLISDFEGYRKVDSMLGQRPIDAVGDKLLLNR